MAELKIAIGKANSGKTQWAVEECLRVIDTLQPTLVLLPSQANITDFRKRLTRTERFHGALNLEFHTFYSLIKSITAEANIPFKEIDSSHLRLLLELFIKKNTDNLPVLASRKLTQGLLKSLLEYFSDLEDGGVTESLSRQLCSNPGVKERNPLLLDIHNLYVKFSNYLESVGYVSRQKLFVKVHSHVKENHEIFKNSHFIVDGFYDYNPIQKLILGSIIPHLSSCSVTLLDGEEEVFNYVDGVRNWLDTIANNFHADIINLSTSKTLLTHIESLFQRDEKTHEPVGIQLLEASGVEIEIQEIIRSVKKDIITQQYAPEDIAVIYRGGEEYYNSFFSGFQREGIAISDGHEQPLITNPAINVIMEWYNVLESNFAREETLRWLGSGYVKPGGDSTILDIDLLQKLSVKAQVLEGLNEWVKRLTGTLEREKQNLRAQDNPVDLTEREIYHSEGLIQGFTELFKRLPGKKKATWNEHINDLKKVMKIINFGATLEENNNVNSDEFNSRDKRALQQFNELLGAMQEISETSGLNRDNVTIGKFASELRSMLDEITYEVSPARGKGVTLANTPEIRGIHWKKVYLVGVLDEVFPIRHRTHPLVKLSDRVFLNELLDERIHIVEHKADLQEERLLFYIALSRATDSVTISTVTGSEDLLPSPFYEELARFYSFETSGDNASNPNVVTQEFQRENAWLMVDLLQHLINIYCDEELPEIDFDMKLFNHLKTVRAFRIGDSFSEYDGQVNSNDLLQHISKNVYDQDRALAPTSLETYYESPFQYFCKNFLKLEELEEVTDELPAADRGLLLHKIMEKFYQALPVKYRGKVTEHNINSSQNIFEATLEEVYQKQEEKGLPIPPMLWEREKQVIRDYAWNAIKFFALKSPWKAQHFIPDAFEFTFGTDEESYPALELNTDNGKIKLRGRADRLDLNKETSQFTVIDYKASRGKRNKDFWNGLALQLPIYAQAARQLLNGYQEPVRLSYYSFKKASEDGKISLNEETFDKLGANTDTLIRAAVKNIISGNFHPTAGECNKYCPFKNICRCEENRIRMKSQ